MTHLQCKHPLIIASSGGGGHNCAAQSIIDELKIREHIILPYHNYQKPSSGLLSFETGFHICNTLYHWPMTKALFRKLISPTLPTPQQFRLELQNLESQNATKKKQYIDFILDIQPNGYAFTALFNFLQKLAHAQSLASVVKPQHLIDFFYKKQVSKRIYQLLIHALDRKQPYDMVISTQPLGLAAICCALDQYNLQRPRLKQQYGFEIPQLFLHQFITDIPNHSSPHYLTPLQKLKTNEMKHLILHVLDLRENNCVLENTHARKIFHYPLKNYPIIHQSFKILPHDIPTIPPKKVGMIMLNSSNGSTTLAYLDALTRIGIEHIIILGEQNEVMQAEIDKRRSQKTTIDTPGFIHSKQIAELLQYTNLLILKGGGLSLMEIACASIPSDCLVGIHQPMTDNKGLSWEEGNTQWFLSYSQTHQRHALTTHPLLIEKHYHHFLNAF